jgi:hypothetical protein
MVTANSTSAENIRSGACTRFDQFPSCDGVIQFSMRHRRSASIFKTPHPVVFSFSVFSLSFPVSLYGIFSAIIFNAVLEFCLLSGFCVPVGFVPLFFSFFSFWRVPSFSPVGIHFFSNFWPGDSFFLCVILAFFAEGIESIFAIFVFMKRSIASTSSAFLHCLSNSRPPSRRSWEKDADWMARNIFFVSLPTQDLCSMVMS